MGTAHGTGVPSCKREGFLLLNGVALDRARAGADAGAGATAAAVAAAALLVPVPVLDRGFH